MPKKKTEDKIGITQEDLKEDSFSQEELENKLPNTALSIARDPVTQAFVLVEIKFDLTSGDVGFVKEIKRGTRPEMVDQFKVEVDNKNIFYYRGL